MKEITTIGVDLAKNVFTIHCNSQDGATVLRKKTNRKELMTFVATHASCLIGMESSNGSHYWARKFKEYGHDVKIMPPQYVKPYVKTNKNDMSDAEAIAEAVTKPNMRFVPIKAPHQQDMQVLHGIRSRLVGNRTALVNSIRGYLMERGITIPQGISNICRKLPEILSNTTNELTDMLVKELQFLYSEYRELDIKVKEYDKRIEQLCKSDESCARLLKIPGVGFLTASYVRAVIGNPNVFKNGRQFAAWVGLVPRQHSTGGKPRLLGISKRGDVYLRTLLIHGARNMVRYSDNKQDRLNMWVSRKLIKRGFNKTCVAVANKNARMIWAILAHGEEYKMVA